LYNIPNEISLSIGNDRIKNRRKTRRKTVVIVARIEPANLDERGELVSGIATDFVRTLTLRISNPKLYFSKIYGKYTVGKLFECRLF